MPSSKPSARSVLGSLVLIALVIGGGAAAFAYTAGWFSPQRLTPDKLVDAFTPPGGAPLGHRRNHAKGICFTGIVRSERGRVGALLPRCSRAAQYPVLGRFNLGTPIRERAGCDGAGAWHGTAHRDAGRAGMAHRHDRCPDLSGVDAADLL